MVVIRLLIVAAISAANVAAVEPPPEVTAKAKAALALAAAARERSKAAVVSADLPMFLTNLDDACRTATRSGKPLVAWVGTRCREHPAVAAGLRDWAVHVHLSSNEGDDSPRLLLVDPVTKTAVMKGSKFDDETPGRFKRAWEERPRPLRSPPPTYEATPFSAPIYVAPAFTPGPTPYYGPGPACPPGGA